MSSGSFIIFLERYFILDWKIYSKMFSWLKYNFIIKIMKYFTNVRFLSVFNISWLKLKFLFHFINKSKLHKFTKSIMHYCIFVFHFLSCWFVTNLPYYKTKKSFNPILTITLQTGIFLAQTCADFHGYQLL